MRNYYRDKQSNLEGREIVTHRNNVDVDFVSGFDSNFYNLSHSKEKTHR